MVLSAPVFLVGFMGAGKTSVARKLARTCGVACVDMDSYIERAQGKRISAIFDESGEQGFRDIESETLEEMTQGRDAMIVSCGGGIVIRESNRDLMKDAGLVIHLMIDADEAASRISDTSSRPLFDNIQNARKRCEERMPLYEDAADYTIDVRGKGVNQVASEVKDILKAEGVLCQQPR